MNKNMGNVDRIVRFVAGVALLSLTIAGPHTLWGLIGIVPLFTAALNWCPLYTVLGISSRTK